MDIYEIEIMHFYRSSSNGFSGSSVIVFIEYCVNLQKPTRNFFSLPNRPLLFSTDSTLNRFVDAKMRIKSLE
jgi:hypothetical protein